MRNKAITLYKNLGLMLSTAILVLVIILAIVTHRASQLAPDGFIGWAVQHHTGIMLAMVLLSVSFGFLWSSLFYAEAMKGRRESHDILGIILLFLGKEDRLIINFLLESGGAANQADISRLEGMNRVKAHRALLKMQEKHLIEVEAHGKIRKVRLKDNIRNILSEPGAASGNKPNGG